MERVVVQWPRNKKNGTPAGALISKTFVATREEKSNAFAVSRLGEKEKEVLTFEAVESPVACWTLLGESLFACHDDFHIQIYDHDSDKVAVYKPSELFTDPNMIDINAIDSPQVIVASYQYLCIVLKKGVYVWRRDPNNATAMLSLNPEFINYKGMVKVFDDSRIVDDELFVCTATTFYLFDLVAKAKIPLFEWEESLGQFFKFVKLDNIVVGVKFASIVIWNLVEKTRKEVGTEAFISALSLDQSFLITGDANGKIQLRDQVTGEIRFNLQYVKDDTETDDVLNESDERATQGGEKEKKKSKKKDDAKSELRIDLTQRINMLQRAGRYIVAAHQDNCVTVWDINKSTKRPATSIKHAGPVRSFVLDGNMIYSGALVIEEKGMKLTHTSSSRAVSNSRTDSMVGEETESSIASPRPLTKSLSNSRGPESSEASDSIASPRNEEGKKSQKRLLKSSASKDSSRDGGRDSVSGRSPSKSFMDMGRSASVKAVAAIEHIAWQPEVDWFNSWSTIEHGSFLPINPAAFKGLEMQRVMEKFPTPIDFYEYQLKQSKFTLLIFYRGIWQDKTFCMKYLQRWHRISEPILKLGGQIIALSCDSAEVAAEAKKKWDLKNFHVLSDPDLVLARHLHLTITKGPKGSQGGVQYPKGMNEAGLFIVNEKRKCLFKWTNTPSLLNFDGGTGRPDPYDTWLFTGQKILNPQMVVSLACKIHLGCPATGIGWKKWRAKDISALPGANVLKEVVDDDLPSAGGEGTD